MGIKLLWGVKEICEEHVDASFLLRIELGDRLWSEPLVHLSSASLVELTIFQEQNGSGVTPD